MGEDSGFQAGKMAEKKNGCMTAFDTKSSACIPIFFF